MVSAKKGEEYFKKEKYANDYSCRIAEKEKKWGLQFKNMLVILTKAKAVKGKAAR